MAATLAHRGPDADGFLVEGRAALGFRRLCVIDLNTGHQPIWNEDRSIAVFQNGEIYNFGQLRQELERAGHSFKTNSDTEAIVHLYEEVGDHFPEHLRGMFAIAVLDRRQQRLVLARDRLGKKPLYYAEHAGRLIYASELKALLSLRDFPRELDYTALLDFFTYRSVQGSRTIFQAALKLPPGHILVADANGLQEPRPYWRLSFAEPFDDPPDRLAARLRELLDESVSLRLIADVPLGAFLSAGIDSAAVAATMTRIQPARVSTFTVGFADSLYDERPGARATARELGTSHTDSLLQLDPRIAMDVLPWYFDEPFADSSAVPTYAVSQAARQNVTVALSGDGGDENFAGYDHQVYDYRLGQLRRLVPSQLAGLLANLGRVYPRAFPGKTTLSALGVEPLRAYFNIVRATDSAFVLRMLRKDVREQLRSYDPFQVMLNAYARTDAPDPFGRVLQMDISTYLADVILPKVDRASMAASLEVRCPLLDHRLVEFAARVPTSMKLRHGISKWILRQAVADRVPPEVLRGPKRGFDVPLRAWTLGALRTAIDDAVRCTAGGLFEPQALDEAWRDQKLEHVDHSQFFWAVLVLDRWRRKHQVQFT